MIEKILKIHAVCCWINEVYTQFFLIFDQHNSPRTNRIKTSPLRLFHNKTPAIDFPQTENLLYFSQTDVPENS